MRRNIITPVYPVVELSWPGDDLKPQRILCLL